MRSSTTIWAFAAFFIVVAATLIAVGSHDAALSGASFGVTVGGAVLVVVGAVLAAAAYQLVRLALAPTRAYRGRLRKKPVVPVAFFLTLLIGVYVFFAGMRAASQQRYLVVAVSLLLVFVAIVGLRIFPVNVTPRKAGAALLLGLLGTLIGSWEFWYQNQYVPAHAGHDVSLKVQLQRGKPSGPYDVVKATLAYEEIGGKSVSVLGSAYTLTGSHVVRCHRPPAIDTVRPFFSGVLPDPQRSRFMADVFEEIPPTVLAAGKFVGDGKRLDPSVMSSRDLVFRVPRNEYQLLRFRAQVLAIPASVPISQRAVPQFATFTGDSELYGFWHIDDDSWFHDLVYGRERWVVLRYEIVDPGDTASTKTTADFRVTARFPRAAWNHQRPGQAEVQGLFGKQSTPRDANEAFAGTELALEPVGEPDAGLANRLHCD